MATSSRVAVKADGRPPAPRQLRRRPNDGAAERAAASRAAVANAVQRHLPPPRRRSASCPSSALGHGGRWGCDSRIGPRRGGGPGGGECGDRWKSGREMASGWGAGCPRGLNGHLAPTCTRGHLHSAPSTVSGPCPRMPSGHLDPCARAISPRCEPAPSTFRIQATPTSVEPPRPTAFVHVEAAVADSGDPGLFRGTHSQVPRHCPARRAAACCSVRIVRGWLHQIWRGAGVAGGHRGCACWEPVFYLQ